MSFHYGFSSSHPDDPMGITYGDPSGLNKNKSNHSLNVSRSRKTAQITSVGIAPNEGVDERAANAELADLINRWVTELAEPPEDAYAFAVFFSRGKAKGHFTHPPHFAIREIPKTWADIPNSSQWNPFVLTYRFRGRRNFNLKKKSEMRQLRALGSFLNVVIPLGVTHMSHGFAWTIDPPTTPGQPAGSQHRQLGYLPGVAIDVAELSRMPDGPSTMQVVNADDCYAPFGPRDVHGLFIPSCIVDAFNKFSALDPILADVFSAAARHLFIAEKVSSDTISYGYIALVSAIETLANQWAGHWWPQEVCEKCDQPKWKLGHRYREFLRTYAGDHSVPLYRQFYENRSRTLHAGIFLRAESKGMWDAGFEGHEDHPNFRYLLQATRVAMINWLDDPLKPPPEPKKP